MLATGIMQNSLAVGADCPHIFLCILAGFEQSMDCFAKRVPDGYVQSSKKVESCFVAFGDQSSQVSSQFVIKRVAVGGEESATAIIYCHQRSIDAIH
jgi:hypothetical protein